jgi:AraC-like DNA-binding protein
MTKRTAFFRQIRIENCLFTVTIDYNFFSTTPTPTKIHCHAAYELHFVQTGHMIYRIDSEDIDIAPGQCCIVCPNVYHSKAIATNNQGYRLKMTLDEGTAAVLSRALPWRNGYCLLSVSPSIFQLLQNIAVEFTSMNWGKDERLHAHLTLMIMELFGNAIRSAIADTPASAPVEDDYATKIDEFFAVRYREDVTLSDLAAALFISERQVSRILQNNYGMSFKSKLMEMRINAAKEQLLTSTDSVTQIAQSLGYSNTRYFTRMFRTNTGYSPSAFRRGYRQSGKSTV